MASSNIELIDTFFPEQHWNVCMACRKSVATVTMVIMSGYDVPICPACADRDDLVRHTRCVLCGHKISGTRREIVEDQTMCADCALDAREVNS